MYSGRPQPYDIDGSAGRQMMNLGQMSGMPPEQAYQQRSSMMMTQPGSYGHAPTNPYGNPGFNRGYPRPGPSIHPGGMSMMSSKQIPMGMGNMGQGYSNSAMSTHGYIAGGGYSSHPHQVTQNPQNLHLGGQGMSSIGVGQSSLMQSYPGGYASMNANGVPGGNSYLLRNQMYPNHQQQMGINQPMSYSQQHHHAHQQPQQHPQQLQQQLAHQQRLAMQPTMPTKRPLESSLMSQLPTGPSIQDIKLESQLLGSTLASPLTPHTTAGISHEAASHQPPPSNTSVYHPYSNIPPTPNTATEEKDFSKRSKELASLFDTYLSQNKEPDSELAKRIKTYIPVLKSKQEISPDILQDCEQLYKQLQPTEGTHADLSLPNTNFLGFFSNEKFPDNRLPPEFTLDIPPNQSERFLKFEIEQLDPRFFSVHQYNMSLFGGGCVNVTLDCQLKREGLPAVPPLIIKIPADYPNSSPESDLMDRYDSTPFLLRVKKCFVEEMVTIPGDYTLTHLLNTWERVVRTVCQTM